MYYCQYPALFSCLSVCPSVRPPVRPSARPSAILFSELRPFASHALKYLVCSNGVIGGPLAFVKSKLTAVGIYNDLRSVVVTVPIALKLPSYLLVVTDTLQIDFKNGFVQSTAIKYDDFQITVLMNWVDIRNRKNY
jgi:hypothetical protein